MLKDNNNMRKTTIKPKIVLNEKDLKKIPEKALNEKNLLKLKLINNEIKNIPKEIENLKRLETFDISNNSIIHTYTKLFELQKLKILNLNNNRIKGIPRQIGKLKELKKLQLSNNLLKQLPKEIEKLENLIELNISYNKFETFPEEIFKLKQLKVIWMGGNFFEILPIEKLLTELPLLKNVYTYSNIKYHNTKGLIDDNYVRLSKIKGNNYSIFKKKPEEIIINEVNNTLKRITSYIMKGQLKKFFQSVANYESLFQHNELKSIYNLQAQWNIVENQTYANIINKENETIEKNKIINGLLSIVLK
ncbi:leucine-rich repeat domain-containing protein [Flagellimonas aquimarina]|nr:leucine-rich repeat domain-containing protein [Allomuricauda koreensis]